MPKCTHVLRRSKGPLGNILMNVKTLKFSFEVGSCINEMHQLLLLPVINYGGEKTLDIWTVRSPVLDPKWRLVRRGNCPRFLTRQDLIIVKAGQTTELKFLLVNLNIMGTVSKSSFLRSLMRRTSAILSIAHTWQFQIKLTILLCIARTNKEIWTSDQVNKWYFEIICGQIWKGLDSINEDCTGGARSLFASKKEIL